VIGDFRREVLQETNHRPWSMPDRPWIMTQTWNDLLFAHWPVDGQHLASKLPAGFELDRFDTEAWIGIVPFHMTNVAPRGVPPIPGLSAFPELNVRTYVRVNGRPGVYFFSLDCTSAMAVAAARTMYYLPYFMASMTVEANREWVEYSSRRTAADAPPAELRARYRPAGPVTLPEPGTLEYFLTERYCLFTLHEGIAYTADIHHPPWPLQAAEADFTINTMAEAAGIGLPSLAPLLHFARRQDMVGWPLSRVE
jgi:uncharacterized protein YqjF (DUF2071 family)